MCGFGELQSGDVFDVLDRLVASLILVIDRDGVAVRYRMLMTVREYGAELLERAREYVTVRRLLDQYRRNAIRTVERAASPGQAAARRCAGRRTDGAGSVGRHAGQLDYGAESAAFLRYWIAADFSAMAGSDIHLRSAAQRSALCCWIRVTGYRGRLGIRCARSLRASTLRATIMAGSPRMLRSGRR